MLKLILLLLSLNYHFYKYDVAAINDEVKIVNSFYEKTVSANTIDKTLKDANLADPLSIYYPKAESAEKFPVVIFVHGWGCRKAAVTAMARFTAHAGFITIAVSAKKRKYPENWLPTLDSALSLLERYANDGTSPIYGKADFSRIALVGHSMGGTAVLHYANQHANIASVVALHPYNGGKGIVSLVGGENKVLGETLAGQKAYTLIITGSEDKIALPEKTYRFFENIDFSPTTKNAKLPHGLFFQFKNVKHNDMIEAVTNMTKAFRHEEVLLAYTLIVQSYLEATLKNDATSAALFTPSDKAFQQFGGLLLETNKASKTVPAFEIKH